MPITPKSAEVLAALRAHVESPFEDNGAKWGQVYLDNAHNMDLGLTRRQFAGHLSALEKAGLYKSQGDNFFGDVKLEG